jgi:hypothetical protein
MAKHHWDALDSKLHRATADVDDARRDVIRRRRAENDQVDILGLAAGAFERLLSRGKGPGRMSPNSRGYKSAG